MEGEKKIKLTVQGFRAPTPTIFRSKQVGSWPSTSLDGNASVMDNLPIVTSNATNDWHLEKEVCKRSRTLPRTLIPKAKNNVLKGYRCSMKVVSPLTAFVQEEQSPQIFQHHEINAFKRSSLFLRSSSMPKTAKMLRVEECLKRLIRSTVIDNWALAQKSSFIQLGAKIVELSEFIRNMNSMHRAIKNMVRTIRELKVRKERRRCPKCERQHSKRNLRETKMADRPKSLTK